MIRDETSQTQSFRTAARPHRRGALVAARNGTGGSRGGCTGRRRLCRPASRQAGHGRSPRRGSEERDRVVARTRPSAPRVRGFASWTRSGFHLRGAEPRAASASRSRRTRIQRAGDGCHPRADLADRPRAGLPVIAARTECELDGYAAVMGWIQVVRIDVLESSQALVDGVDKAPAGHHEWVDGPPQLRGLGVPFTSFGECPTLFDAPASTESDTTFSGRLVVDGEPGCVDQPRVVPGSRAALGATRPAPDSHTSCVRRLSSKKATGSRRYRSARDVPGLAVQT